MNFNDWFKLNWKKASAIIGFLGSAPIVSYIIKYMKEVNDWANLIPFYLNTLLIAYLLVVFLNITPRTDNVRYRLVSDKVRKFNYTWMVFLFVFFIMYLYLTIIESGHVFGFIPNNSPIISPSMPIKITIEYILSETTILALFYCYITISGYRLRSVLFPAFLVWVIGLLAYLIVFSILSSNNANTTILDLAISIIAGGVNCVIFTLFIGRIESKLIAVPLAIISALYLYAALQAIISPMGWAVDYIRALTTKTVEFEYILHLLEQTRGILVIIGAFLKGLLFLVVYWLLDTGILLFYFDWMTNQSSNIENDRRAFLSSIDNDGL